MMAIKKTRRQYGLWDSPITPISMARGSGFSDLAWDQNGTLVWLEARSDRGVLVLQPTDGQAPRDLNSEYSVRGKVGYGGGEFTASHAEVYFVDADSARIFRQPLESGTARPITPAFGGAAAPVLSPDGRWLLFVHTYEGQDAIGIVDAAGKHWPQKLVSGDDFYMQPTWHPEVCSKCALGLPSTVTIVQLSLFNLIPLLPIFTMGSIASVAPCRIRKSSFLLL